MRNSVKTLLALIIVAATLSACGVYEPCSPGDRIDITELEEAAKKDNLEATWGEPVKRLETEDGRVDVYSFMSDRGCLLVIWALVPYPIPTDLPTTGHFTVAYGADGSFKQIHVWHNADSPGEAVDLYLQALADEEVRVEEVAECEAAISEAVKLDRESLLGLKSECERRLGPEASWVLTCLLANHEDARSQYEYGKAYDTGYAPGAPYYPTRLPPRKDPRKAYMWYRLAEISGYIKEAKHCFYRSSTGWSCRSPEPLKAVASALNQEEIAEAEEAIANWRPNLSECEFVAAPEASSP